MKPKVKLLLLVAALISSISCEKDNEWIHIPYETTDMQQNAHLDSVFSAKNNCLRNFEEDKLFHIIYSLNDFKDLDDCHEIHEVDFNNYTLVVGKIQVSSISDKLGGVDLTSKNNLYQIEVTVDKCDECYAAIGYLYFWKLYPKLNSHSSYNLVVK